MFKIKKNKNLKSNIVPIFILGIFIFLLIYNSALAVGDSHIVTLQVAEPDVEDPSIPQNLTATAISSSQINLSWDASTDNIAVTGYKIYRDNVEIDTTTNTTYGDTGLSPSTLYTYKVSAFDAAGNESAQSNEASATTLEEEEEEPATTSSGGGGYIKISVLNFSVEPSFDQAIIKFETNVSTRYTLNWGKSSDYEEGSMSSNELQKYHTILIPDLLPGVKYFFKIDLYDSLDRKLTLDNQTFTTLKLPELPSNVSNLKASPDEEKITLTWNNPSIDFETIRIIRSDKFFPRDPFDGELVYEGKGEKFIDANVVKGKDYFYAVFVRDFDNNYSSGALVRSRLYVPGEEIPDLFAGVIDLPESDIHPLFKKLKLKDFDFIQDGKKAEFQGADTVLIKGDRALKVSLDYEKVPEVLKTLTITLSHPANPSKVFSFLLRINQERNAYEASIAPLGEEGAFGLNVAVLDHKYRGLKKLTGNLKSILPFYSVEPEKNLFLQYIFWILLLLLILILIWRFRHHRVLRINYEAKAN